MDSIRLHRILWYGTIRSGLISGGMASRGGAGRGRGVGVAWAWRGRGVGVAWRGVV